MIKFLFSAIVLLMLLSLLASDVCSQLPPPRERLGVRSGYMETTGKLDEHFGDGSFMTLHFSEKILNPLYLDIKIGAVYLGDLLKPEIILDAQPIDSEMRILFFTAGPQYNYPTGETTTLYGSFGIGIYSVSILRDTGLQAYDFSNQHFGLNGGLGFLWRFAATWNLDVNLTAHKFWTPEDRSTLFYIFTNEGSDPYLYQLGIGISMDLR
jgi:hypothetical protein